MSNRKFPRIRIKNDLRGVSPVVATVLLVGMTVFVTVIVWGIVDSLVEDEIKKGDACFGIFGEVSLNNKFTCYNSSSNEVDFSIDVGDLEVDEILVGISGNESNINFRITKKVSQISGLEMYEGGGTTKDVVAPEKNSGLTYVFDLSVAEIDEGELVSISIAPVVDEVQCEVSDSLSDFSTCTS